MSEAKVLPEPNRGIGGNSQALTHPEVLHADLRERYAEMVARKVELEGVAAGAPEAINDEATSGRIGDQIKQIDGHLKLIENAREAQKEPYLNGGRIIDGFFKALATPLTKARDTLKERDRKYKIAKEEAERQARLKAEREAREEAERLARVAAEEARKAREAEEKAKREREEAERKLREEQERQERERREREEAERKRQEEAHAAEEARLQAAKDEDERRQAEQQRAIREASDKARKEAEDKARKEYEAKETARREAEEKEREKQRAAEAREAERKKEDARKAAGKAAAEAARASKAANAGSAELSRTRGEYGSVGGLRVAWVHDESTVDRAKLDLEALRQHLPDAALHQSIRSFISANKDKAGGPKLKGVTIFEDRVATYR